MEESNYYHINLKHILKNTYHTHTHYTSHIHITHIYTPHTTYMYTPHTPHKHTHTDIGRRRLVGNGASSPLQLHLSLKAKQKEVFRLCTRSLLEAQVLFRHLEIETLKAT